MSTHRNYAERHPHFLFGYPEFVHTRTKNPGAILTSLDLNKVDLLHAAWGIAGEVMEYFLATTQTNRIEELHDIGFYIQMIENRFGEIEKEQIQTAVGEAAELDFDDLLNGHLDLVRACNIFFDYAKKAVIYGNDSVHESMRTAFIRFKHTWQVELAMNGISIEEAQLLNQSKLIKRYSNGYSDKAAAERADKAQGE